MLVTVNAHNIIYHDSYGLVQGQHQVLVNIVLNCSKQWVERVSLEA
jgi:hypothetical protein